MGADDHAVRATILERPRVRARRKHGRTLAARAAIRQDVLSIPVGSAPRPPSEKDAQEAARFDAATSPESEVTAVHRAPSDYPAGKEGDVLTVEFTVLGIPCLGLNGGPEFRHSEACSFQIATDTQEETDRYWNAIVGNGGKESQCGWCKDRWGLSWQITPRVLTEALAAGGGEAKRAFEAMMPMKKIDIATIEAARRG
jgi:2-polyprenyl-6-hydroxyphenyl methylase/3-demethylubiquinone-9 3-methyltransferase